jgi:hypothetical protein
MYLQSNIHINVVESHKESFSGSVESEGTWPTAKRGVQYRYKNICYDLSVLIIYVHLTLCMPQFTKMFPTSRQSNVIKRVLKNEFQIDLHQYKVKKHNDNMYLV